MILSPSTQDSAADLLGVSRRAALEAALEALPSTLPFKRNIRRAELREIVPLGDTTIYELEQRGEFPKRFYLTARCAVWDLDEIEAWVKQRRVASDAGLLHRAPTPDVHQRKSRPVHR